MNLPCFFAQDDDEAIALLSAEEVTGVPEEKKPSAALRFGLIIVLFALGLGFVRSGEEENSGGGTGGGGRRREEPR